MKLKQIILFFCMASFFQSFSQVKDSLGNKEANKALTHSAEIGFNATFLMKQVLSLSNTTTPTLPYQLTYKSIFNNKFAARAGVGFLMSKFSEKLEGSNLPRETESQDISYRIGAEYQHPISNKFSYYVGVDYVGNSNNSKTFTITEDEMQDPFGNPITNVFQVTTTDKSTTNGAGPVLGLQYYITKRLSIFTEMPVYFQQTRSEENVTSYSKVYSWQFMQYQEKTENTIQKTSS